MVLYSETTCIPYIGLRYFSLSRHIILYDYVSIAYTNVYWFEYSGQVTCE